MPRFLGILVSLVLIAATVAGAEKNAAVREREEHYPAWVRWEEYKNRQSDNKGRLAWYEREISILQEPEGVKEALHLNGWEVGYIIRSHGFSFALFGTPELWNKSLHFYDGKLLFNQFDGSLTLMELETGKVVARNRVYSNVYIRKREKVVRRNMAAEWKHHGNILAGSGTLIDAETGAVLDSDASGILYASQKIIYRLYEGFRKNSLCVMDSDTRQKKVLLENQYKITAIAEGDSILCISSTDLLAPYKLRCFSLPEGELLWETPLPQKDNFPAFVRQGDRVYVFAYPYPKNRCTYIHAYDMQGQLLETIPATPDLFGGMIPDTYFSMDYSFKGVQYKGNGTGNSLSSLQREKAVLWDFADTIEDTYGLTIYPLAVCRLPGGGYVWIDSDPENAIPRLHYRDGDVAWSGTIRAVDKLMAFTACEGTWNLFAVGGDEKHIVYISHSGMMECLDRRTGQSRWIYRFPMLYIENKIESEWRHKERFAVIAPQRYYQFFTERAAWCDSELDARDIQPFLVDGRGEPDRAAVIIDPSPDTGHKEDVWPAAVATWTLCLALAAAIAAIWKIGKKRRRAFAYLCAAVACVIVNSSLGGYSRITYHFLAVDFWAAIVLLVLPYAWPHIREWFAAQTRYHSGDHSVEHRDT